MKIEQDIAAPVVEHFRALGCEVYQEVKVEDGGKCADIVAMLGDRAHLVEVKTSLGFDVLAQALDWRGAAEWISVAVPSAKHSRGRYLAFDLARHLGIGIIEVSRGAPDECVHEQVGAQLFRWPAKYLDPPFRRHHTNYDSTWTPTLHIRRYLHEAQRDYCPAGATADQGRYTPFRATCDELRKVVRRHKGGISLSAALREVRHHYASDSTARSALCKWIALGKVRGIERGADGLLRCVAGGAS